MVQGRESNFIDLTSPFVVTLMACHFMAFVLRGLEHIIALFVFCDWCAWCRSLGRCPLAVPRVGALSRRSLGRCPFAVPRVGALSRRSSGRCPFSPFLGVFVASSNRRLCGGFRDTRRVASHTSFRVALHTSFRVASRRVRVSCCVRACALRARCVRVACAARTYLDAQSECIGSRQ